MEPASFLTELADKLHAIRRRNLATQAELEAATGVDQTTVSRVMSRKRKRVTKPLESLMRYADMLLQGGKLPSSVERAAQDFLNRGGTEAELIASIEHSTKLVSRQLT